MTPVELLKSTQRAVASQEMIDWHEQLKDYRKKQRSVQDKVEADQETLTNLEGRQRLQEADVERMREREQIEKHVSHLEAARPLAAYRSVRVRHAEAKGRRKEAQRELTRLQNEVEPSLRAVTAKEVYKQQIQAVVDERKTVVANDEKKADRVEKSYRNGQDRVNELASEFRAERASGQNHQSEMARLKHKIAELERQMSREPPILDPQEYNERIREKQRAITSCNKQIDELKEGQRHRTRNYNEFKMRIEQAERDLSNLDSQAGKQNAKLQQESRDTAKLWEWVQNHQDQFDHPVHGPPIVTCSIKDQKYTNQIESLFQRTNMLTFTTRSNEDLKKLGDVAEKQLHIADYFVTAMVGTMANFKPPVDGSEMSRLGFESWAIDHLSGPEPVLAMLSSNMYLHQTGITLADTSNRQFDMLQDSPIGSWVTSKSHYRITRRREYGPGATSTLVKPIRPGRVWTDQPVDLTAKRELQDNIDGWKQEIAGLRTQTEEANSRMNEYRKAVNELGEEEKAISTEKAAKQKAIGEFKALPTKLASEEQRMETAQQAVTEVKGKMRDLRDQQEQIAMQRAQIALDHAKAVENLRKSHFSLYEAEIMLIEAASDLKTLQDRNRETQELLETQQRQVDEAIRETEAAYAEAQRLMRQVQEMLNSSESSEDLKNFLRGVPETQATEELENEIESERARLELMHEGNDGVIREFENRQRKIASLTTKLEELKEALAELDGLIKNIRDQWEPQLDDLVKQISDSFSNNMEQISCAGEVGIHKDEDFDQWAIQIRVKFRYVSPIPHYLCSIVISVTLPRHMLRVHSWLSY